MSLRCLNRCLFFFISGIKGASVCFDVQWVVSKTECSMSFL
jgi:hypothetical protein